MRKTFRRMSEGFCVWEHKRLQCLMKFSLRPWSRGFDQDLQLSTSLGSLLKLWRSCSRRWTSTFGPIMIFAKEGRRLSGFLKWPGASEEDSIQGMLGQSITLLKMMIGGANSKGHSAPHRLRGNSKAPSDHQLREAEAPGASAEDLAINREESFAYSMVKTKAIPPGCAMLEWIYKGG